MPNIFKDGGGAGIGSFVVVFKDGRLAPETDVLKLRGAYEAGEQIYISVIDEGTKDALVPASGWIDEELKLHLAARDFDDGKTYVLTISDAPVASESEIEYEIKDGIDLGDGEIPTKEDIQEELSSKADLVDGKVPASQLPSYVDDVVEYEDLAHFPEEGVTDKIYLALDTGYTYRWSGTEYVQIGGQDLSEYYTKTEVNDLLDEELAAKQDVISDLDSIRSGAEAGASAVQPADIADDIEVIEYQGQTPITEAQLEKALAGKLAISHNNRLYVKYYQNKNLINFHTFEIGREINGNVLVNTVMKSQEYVIGLLLETRMLSDQGPMPISSVAAETDNFLATGTAPAADGKKLIREANLAELTMPIATVEAILKYGGIPDPVLDNNSWELIRKVCEAGEAGNYWHLGDVKTDVGADQETRSFRICDMQGLYGKHVVFEQLELEAANSVWNRSTNTDDDNCYNNYSISDMRNTVLPALLNSYSNELSGQITNTGYQVAKNGLYPNILKLTDKLFLPACKEIFGSSPTTDTDAEDAALTRFALYEANDTPAFRIKNHLGTSTATSWWLRSPTNDRDGACRVFNNGNAGGYYTSAEFGVAPCFAF